MLLNVAFSPFDVECANILYTISNGKNIFCLPVLLLNAAFPDWCRRLNVHILLIKKKGKYLFSNYLLVTECFFPFAVIVKCANGETKGKYFLTACIVI